MQPANPYAPRGPASEPERRDSAYAPASPIPLRNSPVWLRIPTYQPRATTILLGVLVAIWLFELVYGHSPNASENDAVLRALGAKANDLIVQGEYWRLITAMFLHAGFLHIAFNGYALLIFGQQVERFYGWSRFLTIYFLGGLAGSVASFAFSTADSVGASGAIFGVLGAMGAFFWVHRRLLGATARTQLWNAVAIAGLNLVLGLSQSGAIDNLAHVGGLVGGLVAGLALVPRYRPGRALGPDERLLEDTLPDWAPPAIGMLLLAIEIAFFAVALAVQKGAL